MVSVLEERARYSLSWLKERLYTWAHRFTPRLKTGTVPITKWMKTRD
jgi:hypothetical protein